MIAYVDTSVLLRKLFGEPSPLREWEQIDEAYSSVLLMVEVGRVIDRARLDGELDDEQVAQLHDETRHAAGSVDLLALTEPILTRAAAPMPTVVGTLDAIHLVTALEAQTLVEQPLIFATHDEQLGRAARACGLTVAGVQR